MGVPKFFRYISERYPCLSEVVREYQLPDFDNLYLDMNGIIHVCSHPNDADPHFRITEEKIFRDIFHYIESLFRMIQPRKLFFMAVDGVAPRAKMNQQRGRRFRSAKDAELAEESARLRGELLPSEDRFDSNCITPGTEFMTRLQAQLKYFVTFKISTDKLWQRCKVILSGHETPGEGEHKIMDYIRFMKSRPEYDPNTRHCLYGLDADLIMLGLCTHEPHFSLLREEVKYGKKNNQVRIPTPEETTFFLLHLSLMREYLDLEFQQLKATLPFPYDVEHIIDDWVLMGFLVGNDFIPHLPELHINKGAFPILYKTYIEVLPTLGGYINEGGSLRLDRFQKYMEKLGEFDIEQFKEHNADLKYFEGKTGRKPGGKERHSYKNSDELNITTKNKELAALIASTQELLEDDDDENYTDIDSDEEDDEDDTSLAEFSAHKNNYYIEKLEYEKVTPEVLRSQREGYVRAIQWNLNYYYNGCCSWSWFYPHHYAPYISDIKNFSDLKLEYDLGTPFLPFQQLLAVLPAASKKLLPSAYHDLMVDDTSPIIQFYPTDFKTDLNGKRQEWEAVVLIPFIEQESLIQAMNTKENQLTEEEKSRNKHGPMFVYTYTPKNMGSYVSPAYFPALANHHAHEEAVHREQLYIEPSQLIKGLCPGVLLDVYLPGFPTLKHIPFTAELQKLKVKVFESASQGENMILNILPQGHPDVEEVANELLGKSVFVNWPHLYEARAMVVSSKEKRFLWSPEENQIKSEEMNKSQEAQWTLSKQSIEQRYKHRMGIEVGNIEILVYACTLQDKKFVVVDDKIQVEKMWDKVPIPYALQTTRTEIAVHEPTQEQGLTLQQLYPVDATVFLVDPIYYGCMAKIVSATSPRVKINFNIESEPDLDYMKISMKKIGPHYMSGQTVAHRLGISSHLLSRITGTIYILNKELNDPDERPFKLNIGLNLKFNKRNEEVCGYTKRDRNTSYWLYSSKAEEEVAAYITFFPDVFTLLGQNTGAEDIQGKDLFPEDTENKLAELGSWLKSLDSTKAERQRCGAQVVEEEVVMALEKYIDNFNQNEKKSETITIPYRPNKLYLPKPKLGQAADPKTVHQLFDRVINVRESHTVPLGAKGTIIGLHDMDKGPEAMIDVVFDKEFTGGLKLRCSPHRGYRLPGQALINITYGINQSKNRLPVKPTAVVEPSGTKEDASNWNKGGHNSAFASWRNRPNKDLGDEGVQYSVCNPEQAKNHMFYRKDPPSLPQNNSRQPPVHANNCHHSAPQQLSNEYLAMFKQLQKSSQNPKSQVNTGGLGQLQLDPSSELKKMLKIADDTSKKPTVDNRFTAKSSLNLANSYCMKLLSLHQTKGRVPKYLYSDTKEGAIVCTVICYNGQEYQGAPAFANDTAAENAAGAALQYLGMEEQRGFGGPSHAPPLFNRPILMPRPPFNAPNRFPIGTDQNWRKEPAKPSTLPQPPTKWYQNPGIPTFQPGWVSGSGGGGGATNSFYQSGVQYQQSHPLQHGQYSQHNQWRPPFIPLQAETRVRQQPQPHSRDKERAATKQEHPTERVPNRMPPSSAINTGRNSTRPPRSRIAANFTKPFNFKQTPSDNSQ